MIDPFSSLSQEFSNESSKPTDQELMLYLFWDKGIGYDKVMNYPLPYIFKIMKVWNYVKSEEEKAAKKARRN